MHRLVPTNLRPITALFNKKNKIKKKKLRKATLFFSRDTLKQFRFSIRYYFETAMLRESDLKLKFSDEDMFTFSYRLP